MTVEEARVVGAPVEDETPMQIHQEDRAGCATCLYYNRAGAWCHEWGRQVGPEQSCGRYQSEHGLGGDVVTERVIWFDNVKGKNSKAQGRFCTVPQSDKAAVRLSTELMGWVRSRGRDVLRCQIGALVSRREIWIKPDDRGPFKVSLTVDAGKARTIGGRHLTGRLKAAGMPAGRYYLDEQRSDARTLILVYRTEEARAS